MSSQTASEALRALSRVLVAERSVGDTLLQVGQLTIAAVPKAEMVAVTLVGEDGTPTTGVFTDDEAPEIDAAQYEAGRGPCLDAWRERRVVHIDDVGATAAEYPEFCRAALAHGVGSVLSLPLVSGYEGLGSLNLYARSQKAFSDDDEAVGMELASAAAVVVANAGAYWEAAHLSEQLSEAIRSRAVIEQAKGILMARSQVLDADGAFDVLRRASQRENVKLREIAQRIVDRRRRRADDGQR